MLIANCGVQAKFHNAPKLTGSNIGTTGEIAKVFGENFFATVRSLETRFNRYVRNGNDLLPVLLNYARVRFFLKVAFLNLKSWSLFG